MIQLTRNQRIGLIAFALTLTIGLIIWAVLRHRKLKEWREKITDAIDREIGLLGEDIDQVLIHITADPNYRASDADLQKIYEAKQPIYWPDKPENIEQVIRGKSKPQLKALFQQFENRYGIKFNDHLNTIFSGVMSYDTAGYQKILNLVKNA